MIRLSGTQTRRMRPRQQDVIEHASAPGGLIEPRPISTSDESVAKLQDITGRQIVRSGWLTRLFVGMGKMIAVLANLKAASKTQLTSRVSVMPDRTHNRSMTKKNDRVTVEERRRWMQRRD